MRKLVFCLCLCFVPCSSQRFSEEYKESSTTRSIGLWRVRR